MNATSHTHATRRSLGILTAACLIAVPAGANEPPELSASVLEAIREFNERANARPNEVLVVLEPPTDEAADDVVRAILADDPEDAEDPEKTETAPQPPPNPPVMESAEPRGPSVRIQPLRDTSGQEIPTEDIEIRTPFAAKPLGTTPPGWKLVTAQNVAEFTERIEVAPGTTITLSIRPHVLVPEADGHRVFHIAEPGFDPELGYLQNATISSAISSSLQQLEEDARVLGMVIDELEQILISLPRPASLTPNEEEFEEE